MHKVTPFPLSWMNTKKKKRQLVTLGWADGNHLYVRINPKAEGWQELDDVILEYVADKDKVWLTWVPASWHIIDCWDLKPIEDKLREYKRHLEIKGIPMLWDRFDD